MFTRYEDRLIDRQKNRGIPKYHKTKFEGVIINMVNVDMLYAIQGVTSPRATSEVIAVCNIEPNKMPSHVKIST